MQRLIRESDCDDLTAVQSSHHGRFMVAPFHGVTPPRRGQCIHSSRPGSQNLARALNLSKDYRFHQPLYLRTLPSPFSGFLRFSVLCTLLVDNPRGYLLFTPRITSFLFKLRFQLLIFVFPFRACSSRHNKSPLWIPFAQCQRTGCAPLKRQRGKCPP